MRLQTYRVEGEQTQVEELRELRVAGHSEYVKQNRGRFFDQLDVETKLFCVFEQVNALD